MTDKRELILERLVVLAAALPGVKLAARNLDQASEGERPAVVVFDADEHVAEVEAHERVRHRAGAAQLVTMSPEIVVSLAGPPETVGSDLNVFRAALIKAVVFDDADGGLVDITGAGSGTRPPRGGAIRYLACATSLGRGRTMEGDLGLYFEFTYTLEPGKL